MVARAGVSGQSARSRALCRVRVPPRTRRKSFSTRNPGRCVETGVKNHRPFRSWQLASIAFVGCVLSACGHEPPPEEPVERSGAMLKIGETGVPAEEDGGNGG